MDPVRSESAAPEPLTGVERDARIEQLLLTGLDHYFAADYEQAINIWTRVLFVDRHHDRARAYIERARSAQAERQRESEALMHQGLDALTSGDIARARALVADALARGASRDLAIGVLDRIERLGVTPSAAPQMAPAELYLRPAAEPARLAPTTIKRRGWMGVSLLILAALGWTAVAFYGVALPDVSSWFSDGARRAAPTAVAVPVDPVPLPSATELYLTRSRTLFKSGHLRDALRELDRVPVGDSSRDEADRLRAQIQLELLAAASAEPRTTNEVP